MSHAAVQINLTDDLLAAYAGHCGALELAISTRDERLAAARRFLKDHDDLTIWMGRPLQSRLVDLKREPGSWALIGFALLSGRISSDIDFLAAKHAGHSLARATAAIYQEDVADLRRAADRLGWAPRWTDTVLCEGLPFAIACTGHAPSRLTVEELEKLRAGIKATPHYSVATRRARLSHLHSLGRLCYEAHIIDQPPVHRRGEGLGNLASRLAVVTAPEVRRVMLAYLEARRAVLKPCTIRDLASNLASFGEFISKRFPELVSLTELNRSQVEAFCSFLPTRRWRGQRACGRQVSQATVISTLADLRSFLEDICTWGWAEAPARRLVFASDIPRPLPRALAPNVDSALMDAVARLEDRFARVGLTVLRGAGLRIGELLDLELDCVTDYGPAGSWLRVPLGKLDSERSVPLDQATLMVLQEWVTHRGTQRALPHQRDGRMVDFLFVERGRRPGDARIVRGLREAIQAAGLMGPDGLPLHVVPHQLRHTYATALVNAGMSLQGLMALLGHQSPEMTLRYATLASPTLRRAYDTAAGKVRPLIQLPQAGPLPLPDRVSWLASEMLKTRVAHGYCARELVAEACPYANVCESCAYFVSTPEFIPVLEGQLADVQALRDDARARGWDSEIARHDRVIITLEGHLERLRNSS